MIETLKHDPPIRRRRHSTAIRAKARQRRRRSLGRQLRESISWRPCRKPSCPSMTVFSSFGSRQAGPESSVEGPEALPDLPLIAANPHEHQHRIPQRRRQPSQYQRASKTGRAIISAGSGTSGAFGSMSVFCQPGHTGLQSAVRPVLSDLRESVALRSVGKTTAASDVTVTLFSGY